MKLNKEQIYDIYELFGNGATKSDVARYIQDQTGLKETQSFYWSKYWYDKFDGVDLETILDQEFEPLEITNKIKVETQSTTDGNLIVTSYDGRVTTAEQLLKVANIDLSQWKIERQIINKWDSLGRVQDGDKIISQPVEMFQVKLFLAPKKEVKVGHLLLKTFVKNLENHQNLIQFEKNVINKNEDFLVLSTPDLHIAKLTWHEQSGHGNYDSKEAVACFNEAVNHILGQVNLEKIGKFVLPIGNDYFNIDNALNTTTAGTPQDVDDSRLLKMFRLGCQLVTDLAERLLQYAPVDMIIVPGNHDETITQYLGEYVKAWFRNTDNFWINADANLRKYYSLGNNMFCFTHGNDIKLNNLPIIMANERPDLWAKCKYRECHLGHFHYDKVEDTGGVKVRILPSLCKPDFWHSKRGYVMAQRGAEALIYNLHTGLKSIHYYNAD